RSRPDQGQFSPGAAARARAGGVGYDGRRADGREPAQGAAHVRGLRHPRGRVRSGRMILYDALIAPFVEFEFMRRAIVGALASALGAGPIGVFLMLRRMSLVGDAMSHAILPGAALGFLLSGLSLFAMTAGGLVAGFVIALTAGLIARATELKE